MQLLHSQSRNAKQIVLDQAVVMHLTIKGKTADSVMSLRCPAVSVTKIIPNRDSKSTGIKIKQCKWLHNSLPIMCFTLIISTSFPFFFLFFFLFEVITGFQFEQLFHSMSTLCLRWLENNFSYLVARFWTFFAQQISPSINTVYSHLLCNLLCLTQCQWAWFSCLHPLQEGKKELAAAKQQQQQQQQQQQSFDVASKQSHRRPTAVPVRILLQHPSFLPSLPVLHRKQGELGGIFLGNSGNLIPQQAGCLARCGAVLR